MISTACMWVLLASSAGALVVLVGWSIRSERHHRDELARLQEAMGSASAAPDLADAPALESGFESGPASASPDQAEPARVPCFAPLHPDREIERTELLDVSAYDTAASELLPGWDEPDATEFVDVEALGIFVSQAPLPTTARPRASLPLPSSFRSRPRLVSMEADSSRPRLFGPGL